MKKTLLALAVLAAGSAQAGVNLYDQDGVVVDVAGAAEVQYIQGYAENSDSKFRLDDGDLAFNVTVPVSNNLNAVSGLAFNFEDAEKDEGAVKNDELWVGFSSNDFGTITFGRQYLIADDSGIGKDVELGGDGLDFVQAQGDQTVKYVFDNGQFYAGLSALLKETNPAGNADETSIIDGRIGARFGDLDARVYLYSGSDVKAEKIFGNAFTGGVVDVDGYNLEGEYIMGAFAFAASFGQVEYENAVNSADKLEADTAALAGSYTMDKTTFALGYTYLDFDVAGANADANTFYANVTQQMHANVKVYGEIGTTDVDNTEFGYLAGMEVSF
ncbi:porin [Photobacterium chitinilyticum]|uniref:Porin n=1 Tax=Photobacterium chitinilyticum TaxID=2485123 RepID=A0A3S3S0Q5_9GAMM|nr:porin [Photobacterium chitinilyticum]RWX55168.1 porin [Photobacterium chitinilyticum]